MDDEIRLTPNMLKTIGEKTRMQILNLLSTGPKIPADISKKLDKSTPTIIEHLNKLATSGLVERRERQNRKYVFYSLTQTGQELVSGRSRAFLVLYTSIIALIFGFFLFSYSITGQFAAVAETAAVGTGAQPALTPSSTGTFYTQLYWISVAIILMAFLLLLFYLMRLRRIRFRIGG